MSKISEHPKRSYPKPPFPQQAQKSPGRERELRPNADHGERSYEGSGKLVGRKALITGADSGIGKAVAIAFAREGADIFISYLNEKEDAEDTAYWVKKAGRKAILDGGDITDEGHCQKMSDELSMSSASCTSSTMPAEEVESFGEQSRQNDRLNQSRLLRFTCRWRAVTPHTSLALPFQ